MTPPFQEVDLVHVRFCGNRAQHQRSRTGPNVTVGQSQTTRRTHRLKHSRGNTTVVKTKAFFLLFFILGELPRLFSQPAELRAACTGLSPLPRLQQHTLHPPDWPCHTTACQNPPQPGHKLARTTHRHTYPNTRLPTINHYSGGLGGCF